MPRSKQITVYKFSELSDEAKQHAKDHFASFDNSYNWSVEALDSLKALATHFHGKLADYQIDYFNNSPSRARFDMPDLDQNEIAELLAELGSFNPDTLTGHGECKLTGFCHDESAIDGFRQQFHRDPTTPLIDLMGAAFQTWLSAVHTDCADQYSDDTFSENCDANKYEFNASGDLI